MIVFVSDPRSSRSLVRTAMSSSVTMPASRSPSRTGRRLIPKRAIVSAASSSGISGVPVMTGAEAWPDAATEPS